MRTGLFGGTFNPVHNGHITVAGDVRIFSGLDKIVFIPSLTPPHKRTAVLASPADRYEMIRLAISGDSGFDISDAEMNRPGPSYTFDTVNNFKKEARPGDRFFLIMGLDAFLELDTWKSYRELLQQVPFIVMTRPVGDKKVQTEACIREVGGFLTRRISAGYRFYKARDRFEHPENAPVHIVAVTPVSISSTMIRRCLKNGQSIHSLVPDVVSDYIRKKGLYL